jgi:polyhydroxyalkanoate synthesis regulator phasin
LDENGNELDFTDKIILKAHELKEELYDKIEERVVKVYKKMNIAHLDEIKAINEKLEKANATIALLEARLNILESK